MAVVRLGVDYGKGDQSMLWVVDDASYFTAESWKYIGEFAVVPRYYADTASDRSKHMRYYLSPQEPLPQNEPAVIEDVTYKSFGGQKGFEFYEFEGHIYLIVTQLYDKLTAVFEDQRNHPFELKCVIQR